MYVPRASFDISSINEVTGHYELDYYNTYKAYQTLIDKYGLTLSDSQPYYITDQGDKREYKNDNDNVLELP